MKKWIVCLVIGLGMLAFGSGVGVNDNTIRCGSEIMGPGDVCEETRNGSVTDTETYEEMKASKEAGQRTFNSWGRWVLLGGGLLLTGFGIWGIVKVKRAKKQEPYLGPGYTPGQAEPRQPGQPVGQYMQGMTPLPPGPPVAQGPQQGYAPPQPNYAPPQQQYPPQPPQQNYPQQPFGPGSQ